MVACELDKEVAGDLMGWKLPAWQALLLHRVFPAIGGLLVYLILICFDLTLIVTHFRKGDEALGVFCSVIVVLPSLLAFVFTLASSPPGLQTDLTAFSISVEKKDLRWLGKQFVNAIFFPIAAIGRYCFLIFWWIEAVFASRLQDEERTREAILEARSPSPMELYLFLQSFIHAAPHAIVNILDLFARFTDLSYDQVSVQAVSIIVSCLRMASTATVYRRFEREKLCGRNYPWSRKCLTENEDNDEPDADKNENANKEEEQLYESITHKESLPSSTPNNSQFQNTNSDLIEFSPRTTVEMSSSFFDNDSECSECSSNYLPPISPVRKRISPTYDSDDEYVRPISIIDRVAPKRRDTGYTIEKVEIVPPPVMLAPRPGSLAVWAEKMVENAESIPYWLSAPPRRKYCDEVIEDEPDVPHRVPRAYMRGLEPQDLTAAIVHFLGWYAFFISRLLSIACIISSFPVFSIIILMSHYQAMLLFLIVPQAQTVRRAFYIFLAFVYIFCLMEFKVRFRHVRVWHVFWGLVCTIEIILFTGLWVSIDNNLHNWWKGFLVKVIVGSMGLSLMCFLCYFIILKPRQTIVYINKNKNNAK